MIVKNCRICQGDLKQIINLGKQPLANALKDKKNSTEKKYRLELFFCNKCKVLQISKDVNLKALFQNYVWNTGVSKSAQKFSQIFYSISKEKIKKFIGDPKFNKRVLEIASNDGTFLLPFKNNNFFILGVDPAKNITDISSKKNINVHNDFFNYKISKVLKKKYGNFDYIFARNVIAHNPDVNSIFRGIKNIISNDGLISIEFHYSKNIFDKNQYDSIYHEHIYYFSLLSIQNLLKLHKFKIVDVEVSPISGGSLIVFAQNNKSSTYASKNVDKFLKNEKKSKLNNISHWRKFEKKVIKHKDLFIKKYSLIKNKYKKVCFYGASARSSTFLNYTELNFEDVVCIFDKSEIKINSFSPGTNIKILGLENMKKIKPDLIIVLAWNFFDEIAKDLINNYNYKNDIMKPFPLPKILSYEDYSVK